MVEISNSNSNVTRQCYGLVSCLLICLLGCDGGPSLDGTWRLQSTSGLGLTCIDVMNNQIVRVDDGCDGSLNLFTSNQPATITGSRAIWSMILTTSLGTSLFTIDGTLQSDGSMIGVLTVIVNSAPFSSGFIGNRL